MATQRVGYTGVRLSYKGATLCERVSHHAYPRGADVNDLKSYKVWDVFTSGSPGHGRPQLTVRTLQLARAAADRLS